MEKCVILVVAFLAASSFVVAGRSYLPVTRYEEYRHNFEHHQPGLGHKGPLGWDHASRQRPSYYQKEFTPYKHIHDDKEFWKILPTSGWDSDSWEYPDYTGHGHHNTWGHQGWGNHGNPNHYGPHQPGSQPNRPTWNQGPTWGPVTQPPTSPSPTTESESQATLAIASCIRSCPVTSEYNPVCGSNNVTYGNPGRLECAKYCGVDVTLQRNSACPPPGLPVIATQDPTTARPTLATIKPTRFTTVDIPATVPTDRPFETKPPVTIPQDILNSIFTSPPTPTEDDNYEIDIRTS